MNWLYPSINSLISDSGYALYENDVDAMRHRVETGVPLSGGEQYEYGLLIKKTQPLSLAKWAASVLSYVSESWNASYLAGLAQRYVELRYIPPKKELKKLLHEQKLMQLWLKIKNHKPFPTALVRPLGLMIHFPSHAFYKQSSYPSSASAHLERMVWEIANEVDVEEQFAPTKIAPMQLLPLRCYIASERAIPWAQINPAQLPMTTIIDALVTALVLGCHTVKKEHLFLNDKGLICFQWNSDCMPPSNNTFQDDKGVHPSFYCAIADLPQCCQKLQPDERDFLTDCVEYYHSRLHSLTAYLRHPLTSPLSINPVPREQIIAAFEERVHRLWNKVITSRERFCLNDLIQTVHPLLHSSHSSPAEISSSPHFSLYEHEDMIMTTAHKTSLQQELAGTLLGNCIDTKRAQLIPRQEIIRAFITSLFFGFSDAHAANILVTPDWKIRFFDNTRSFCHSNGVLSRAPYSFISAFRTGLFELEACYTPLTETEKTFIFDLLCFYASRIPAVEAYLKSVTIKRIVRTLPEHWFVSELAINALKERLHRLLTQSHSVTCLRDLAFIAHPEFRFIAALALTYNPNPELNRMIQTLLTESQFPLLQRQFLSIAGTDESLLRTLITSNPRVNPTLVRQWARTADMSFETILKSIASFSEVPTPAWNEGEKSSIIPY